MAFTLRKATTSDAAEMVEMYFPAFSKDAISLLCFPRTKASYDWWYEMVVAEMTDPDSHFLVITTPSSPSQTSPAQEKGPEKGEEKEQIIAWCKWNTPSTKPLDTDLPTWPAGADIELADHFFGNLFRRHIDVMGEERRHWYLEIICTRPEWWGKGAAGMLIRWGLERVDGDGAEAYLEASPDGKPVYERFGWREVDRLVVDLRENELGEREFVEVMMRRPAKGVA